MQAAKLYQALVLGGAVLVAGSCQRQQAPRGEGPQADSGKSAKASAETKSTAEKKQAFCGPADKNTCDKGAPLPGIECCWNTSC